MRLLRNLTHVAINLAGELWHDLRDLNRECGKQQ